MLQSIGKFGYTGNIMNGWEQEGICPRAVGDRGFVGLAQVGWVSFGKATSWTPSPILGNLQPRWGEHPCTI